jgi:hypothetical protein
LTDCEILGQPASIASPTEDLVSRLRDAQTRPAILLVASHCESTPGPIGPIPRIQLPGKAPAPWSARRRFFFESLAVRFAKNFTPEMREGCSQGATMLRFRRALLQQSDPLGFLFTAYGPADLATRPPSAAAAVQSAVVEPA